jgi:hypothetical protein
MKLQNNIYILLGGFFLVVMLLVVFLIYPMFLEIKNDSESISLIKEQVASIGAQSTQLDSFKEKYQSQQDNLKNIDRFFVDAKDPIDFIKFLEAMASHSGVSINITLVHSKEAQLSQTGDPVAVFQVRTTGPFSGTVRFAQQLESGNYLVNIKSMTIKKAELDDAAKTASADVEAVFLINAISR